MGHKEELKHRIEARKRALEAKLLELEANAEGAMQSKIDYLKQELNNLKDIISDGWENITESASEKLNDWLKKTKEPDLK